MYYMYFFGCTDFVWVWGNLVVGWVVGLLGSKRNKPINLQRE